MTMLALAGRLYFFAAGAVSLLAMAALLRSSFSKGSLASKLGWLMLAILGTGGLFYEGLVTFRVVSETYIRFGRPYFLAATAAAAVFLTWALLRLPIRNSAGRRKAVAFFSAGSVLAAALILAEPELGAPMDKMTVVFAIDRSRSIELVADAEKRMSAELQVAETSMRKSDRVAHVVFGAEAATEDPPRPRTDVTNAARVSIPRDATNIENAIRHAVSELPSDSSGRVVLVSDGVQTKGDALNAAAAAMTAGVPIDVLVLEQRKLKDIRLVSVRGPSKVSKGEPLDLRVVTSSGSDADVVVRLKRDGVLVKSGTMRISAGEDTLRIRELADEPGLHRYDVEVSSVDPSLDASPEDNRQSTFVRVVGPSLILVLEGDEGRGAPLRAAFDRTGAKTIERGLAALPSDIGELAGFDLVVLSDVRASDMSPTQIDALASYVKDLGGGLLLMGGDRSLGPGGYARTPIEEISPVSFDLKKEQRRASLAEVILIDYSGSMSATVPTGQTKLSLANEAAARSADLLSPGDRLGVAHVDTVVAWTIPLAPVVDPAAIGARIRAVTTGGGGIYTDLALREGYAALRSEKMNLKHTLLFADGSDAEQLTGCRGLVKDAFDHGITTSVISLGKGSDTPELEVLSKIGNGRFYLIEDATRLPSVFAQETVLASKGAISEKPFRVGFGAPTPAIRNVPFQDAPALGGYVITVAKPRATVGLVGPENDPIYATWSAGLGRTAAFTSDFKDRWGKDWLKWPHAIKFFSQVAQDISRKQDDPKVRLMTQVEKGELRVSADVVGDDGRAQTFRRFRTVVTGPDGFSREVSLEAVGAGRYAGALELTRPGVYVASVRDEASNDLVGITGATFTSTDEMAPTGSDRLLLERIAKLSGGKVRDSLAGIFDERTARRFAYQKLSNYLAAVSALFLLFGVIARRFGMPDAVIRARENLAQWVSHRRLSKEQQMQAAAAAKVRSKEIEARNRELIEASKKRLKDAQEKGRIVPTSIAERLVPPSHSSEHSPPKAGDSPADTRTPAPPKAAPQAERQLSTAERLAQKRREKKG